MRYFSDLKSGSVPETSLGPARFDFATIDHRKKKAERQRLVFIYFKPIMLVEISLWNVSQHP
jgi:hypothetical protein